MIVSFKFIIVKVLVYNICKKQKIVFYLNPFLFRFLFLCKDEIEC